MLGIKLLIWAGFAHGGKLERSPAALARGKAVFQSNCMMCHGVHGDGQGVAARAIKGTKPRNFVRGEFKYGATPDELFKTISQGVPGSAMPSWNTLPEEDRWAVIYYLKDFHKP